MNEFKWGLEGVVAVETAIAAPDREGGALRSAAGHRGARRALLLRERLGLLVDDDIDSKMPDPEPYVPTGLTGNAPADLQSEVAHLAGEWKPGKPSTSTTSRRDDLGRLSAQMMGIVARRPQSRTDANRPPTTSWRKARRRRRSSCFAGAGGEPDHVKAIDTYWICTAEHGLNASTFTARVVG